MTLVSSNLEAVLPNRLPVLKHPQMRPGLCDDGQISNVGIWGRQLQMAHLAGMRLGDDRQTPSIRRS